MPKCLERISLNSSVPLIFKLGVGNIQHHFLQWLHLGTTLQTSLRRLGEVPSFLGIPVETAEKFDHSSMAIQDILLNHRCFYFILNQFSEMQQSTCHQPR